MMAAIPNSAEVMSGIVPVVHHRSRGYQLEMLEESLRRNIIVAMDTGSGKTHIAILRIMAELDRCPPEKLVWFMAPTVELCYQQYDSITKQLPAVTTKIFVGSDNTVGWTEQRLWDAALKNVRIVVSTHEILADALVSHAFVRLERLALLVFDEAHHCTRKHPSNRIMKRYHEELNTKGRHAIPYILGLTASPIKRSRPTELSIIEANLDSISRTPRRTREELMKYVHRPKMVRIGYDAGQAVNHSRHDIRWKQSITEAESQSGTTDLSPTSKKCCQDQLEKLWRKSAYIEGELGVWAADYLIFACTQKLKNQLYAGRDDCFGSADNEEAYMLRIIGQIKLESFVTESPITSSSHFSQKLQCLISFLVQRHREKFSGMVFVQQRATVSILCKILSQHEQTRDLFRCAPYVGRSDFSGRKQSIMELHDVREQQNTLEDFRKGRFNLIVTTDVLEEGVDIPVCSLVVCFNKPPNLKSFIQKRGRARQIKSAFAVMVASDDKDFSLEKWLQLEAEMIRAYQDDSRLLRDLQEAESALEMVEETLSVESTGAFLSADSAIAHLYHFCAVLPPEPYTDMRPAFAYRQVETNAVEALVTLPSSVSTSLRQATSRKHWRTERAAMKDAALQSYTALYKAGLVNENLLPLNNKQFVPREETQRFSGTLEISEQYSPWIDFARAAHSSQMFQTEVVSIKDCNGVHERSTMLLTTPVEIPDLEPLLFVWDDSTTFTVRLHRSNERTIMREEWVEQLRDITHLILRSTHSDRNPDERRDFVVLFGPKTDESRLEEWLCASNGRRPALEVYPEMPDELLYGIVQSQSLFGLPHIFSRWYTCQAPDAVDNSRTEIEVKCVPLPRRRNFLHRNLPAKTPTDQARENNSRASKEQGFSADQCTFDRLPFEAAQFGLFIPAILQHAEVLMVANRLQQSVLRTVTFNDQRLLVSAISARSAQWTTNYERLEFLGDSNLKLVVSIQLFVDHLNWHEGYLSDYRSYLVSNSRLCRAAIESGLDRFILTATFGRRKWTIPLISDLKSHKARRRRVKSKVLADVVEALIGAAFCSGGLSIAWRCVHCFLPDISDVAPSFDMISRSRQWRDKDLMNTRSLCLEETIIGHHFQDKILLREALNHPSCERDVQTESYQRLEFLGDAVLDVIVVSTLFSGSTPSLSQGQMTMIKAALVNSDFLGYLCMSYSVQQQTTSIEEKKIDSRHILFRERPETRTIPLCKFMRHHSPSIIQAQTECLGRCQRLGPVIDLALKEGKIFPWTLLIELKAEKFLSDIIESLLGAIFVDTSGNLEVCKAFVEKIGLLGYLRRVVDERIDVRHPKSF